MSFKKQWFQLALALIIGLIVFLLPRPEGTSFKLIGDGAESLLTEIAGHFTPISGTTSSDDAITVVARNPGSPEATVSWLTQQADEAGLENVHIDYVDGLSPTGKRFLIVMAVLVMLFIFEPVPLEVTAICIGVFLVVMGIADVKGAWAPYMHPVVVFIMCCLIFAISLDKAGLTKRIGYFIVKKAGSSVTRFTFVLALGLGWSSAFMHDAAACAVGIVTMLPMMRAVGVKPHSNTARFMIISLAFACSCGGMGSLVGGGRCMVAAAFLKEFTGIEITFFEWIKYAMPAALLTVPIAVAIVYFIFRPDPHLRLPEFTEEVGPLTLLEKKTLVVAMLTLLAWLTKGLHGIDYSVTGMLGVTALVLTGVLKWDDIQKNLEWGTALFIFGGGISLGLAMGDSGAAAYLANLFFPFIQGGGWLLLFIGVGVFGALVTNAMANVAAAALILPIVIPMAEMEGVDPTILALCLGTCTSFALILVIGCPPNAIAYSYRYFRPTDLARAGAIATPVLLAVVVLVAAVWWHVLGLTS